MKKRIFRLCAVLFCCLCLVGKARAGEEESRTAGLRALLIGCDEFVTMPAITPAAENNLRMLSRVLQSDSRGYDSIISASNTLKSAGDLSELVSSVFAEAGENDLSFIYIGTHGLRSDENEYVILLSDGTGDTQVTGTALREMLEKIPGEVILVLDTCYSGAYIGKGLSDVSASPLFGSDRFTVFCAAGAEEISFCFRSEPDGGKLAASFFCSTLCRGLSDELSVPADADQDGCVTADEMQDYLYENYGVSTPQVYPTANRERILYQYDRDPDAPRYPLLDSLSFEDDVITGPDGSAVFSYRLNRSSRVFYQLVYYQEGQWQFSEAQQLSDSADGGPTAPGLLRRSLQLTDEAADQSGYVLFNLITLGGDGPQLQGSRLLNIQSEANENPVTLETAPSFRPAAGEELPMIVRHPEPCSITASVLDESDSTVCLLCYMQPSRPQNLSPEGTLLYWNGRTSSGQPCPPGEYRLRVQVRTGRNDRTLISAPFTLAP